MAPQGDNVLGRCRLLKQGFGGFQTSQSIIDDSIIDESIIDSSFIDNSKRGNLGGV